MARTLDEIAQLKERQKWSHVKPKLDNARELRGLYFIDLEDKEFKETIKNARKKSQEIGNANGSCHALQDMQEKQAWGDQWQIQ